MPRLAFGHGRRCRGSPASDGRGSGRDAFLRAPLRGAEAGPPRRFVHGPDRAERLLEYLERAGFVVMRRPPAVAPHVSLPPIRPP